MTLRDPAEINDFWRDAIYVPSRTDEYRLDVDIVGGVDLQVQHLVNVGDVVLERESYGTQTFAVYDGLPPGVTVDGVEIGTRRTEGVIAVTTRRRVVRLTGRSSYSHVLVPGQWFDTRGRPYVDLGASEYDRARLTRLITLARWHAHRGSPSVMRAGRVLESVADSLHRIVDASTPPMPAGSRHPVSDIVADALSAIHDEQAASVADLVRLVPASRSTLYRSFESVLGMSPYEYMQRLRLIRFRRGLLDAEAAPGAVTQQAAQIGAFHLGNLAKSYREMFGELPSETLEHRRSRSRSPELRRVV